MQHEEAKIRRSQSDKPCHRPRESLFSLSSGLNNFTGFVNCCFLLMAMGGICFLLENFINFGNKIDLLQWNVLLTGGYEENGKYPSIILLFYALGPIVVCLLIEKKLALEIVSHQSGMIAHFMNLVVMVLTPMVAINIETAEFSLAGAVSVCMFYSILFLKLWSYIQVNMWCRQARTHPSGIDQMSQLSLSFSSSYSCNNVLNGTGQKEKSINHDLVQYPNNLYLNDILYFVMAPTMCYELNFPKTNRMRKGFLIKRMLELMIGIQVVFCLFQQWIIPSAKNLLIPFSNVDIVKTTERLFKLAILSHFVWMILFYLLFHSFLNLTGELLYFADRNFYCDWWNADNIVIFWRNWNMPVHRWAVRHLYIPVIESGYGKTTASILVFFISAFFHEYFISIPLKTFKIWAFVTMMAQVPMSVVSHFIANRYGPRWGNLVVWASLIVGQPLCIMLYYHDYVVTHFGEKFLERQVHG